MDSTEEYVSDDFVEDSSTDDVFESKNTISDPSTSSNVKENQDQSESDSDETQDLSLQVDNKRISKDFKLNQRGILNSTTIDSSLIFTQHRKVVAHVNQDSDSDSSVEVLSESEDVVEISTSESESSPVKPQPSKENLLSVKQQGNLLSFVTTKKVEKEPQLIEPSIGVSSSEFNAQTKKVRDLEIEFGKISNMLLTIKLDALPDKGQLLKNKHQMIEKDLKVEQEKLSKMVVTKADPDKPQKAFMANWEDLKAGTNAVLPKTFGTKAMSTYNAQKALTLETLEHLHGSLKRCPKENDHLEDPNGLKVSLMPHQKRALAWLVYRETQKPSGGILADDMGLGKTLTMISLIVKSIEEQENNDKEETKFVGKNSVYKGGTLVVCPASLLQQWSGEIDRRLQRGLISYLVYHGTKRETNPKKLSQYMVVITTYSVASIEKEKNSPLFKINWRRVILDEAHQIRNYKSQTSMAVCQLTATSRWALTGTPLHNKELDMYALLKFLRCSPFDELPVWKRWVTDKTAGGQERLHTVISSLMLRRTKAELMENGALTCLPSKKWDLITVSLAKDEMSVYHKVLMFSQTLFAQFLHQRAEKNQDYVDQNFPQTSQNAPNAEYFKIRRKLLKMNKVKNVSQHEILVLLLRLRQICCHPSLINSMLRDDDIEEEGEESSQLNLLEQLSKLNIEDDDEEAQEGINISQSEKVTLKEASKGLLNPSHPVFSSQFRSSKVKATIGLLKERVLEASDKAIIVSQWSSYLDLIASHLKEEGIAHYQLDGKVPVHKRVFIVDKWNDPSDTVKVLLLSLTAGGVGLNLIGANHLFLLDLHWNPQLENQAQDRIYRVGQTKPIFVYKFLATDTIEERIKALQDRKIAMADGMLSGTKQVTQSKLTLQDLRMIFGM